MGPLYPKIFNVVVDAVIRYWVIVVAPVKDGTEGLGFGVLGAYLHASLPGNNKILIKFEREFTDIMCEVKPGHRPNMRIYNYKKVLYVQVLKDMLV